MRKIRFDYHIHSEASHDSRTTVKEIINASKDKLDAIAVTDHDAIYNSLKAVEEAPSDLTVIPGVEVSTKQGHLIALNIEEKPDKGEDIWDTISEVKKQNGFTIIPHPFQMFRHGIKRKNLQKISPDAIETFNSRYFIGFRNYQAAKYATKHNMPKTASSDAHVPEMIGKGQTIISVEEKTPENILEQIKKGETQLKRSKTPSWKFVSQASLGLRKRLQKEVIE